MDQMTSGFTELYGPSVETLIMYVDFGSVLYCSYLPRAECDWAEKPEEATVSYCRSDSRLFPKHNFA